MTSLKHKTISSLIWKLLEQGGSAVASLGIQIVMARLLTPDDFGVLAIMLVFINLSIVFVQSGLNTALIQAKTITTKDLSTVFWLSMLIAGILYLAIFLGAPAIARFYDSNTLVPTLRILALVLFLNALYSVQVSKITRDLELRKTFLATIIATITSGIAGIVIALGGGGVWALVAQQLAYQATNCLVLFFRVNWHPTLQFSSTSAKTLFGYSWKLLVAGLLDAAYVNLTNLIIGKFSKEELGYVSQGQKYPLTIGNILDGTIQPVMLSTVSRVQENLKDVLEVTRRGIKTSSFLVVPTMGALALTAEPLIAMILGEQWIPAAPFMQMFCFIYAMHPIQNSNIQAINGIGRSDLFLKLEALKKTVGIIITCIAAFMLQSVYAIVAGMVLNAIIASLINAAPNRRLINYPFGMQARDIFPAFVLTALAMIFAYPIGLTSLPLPFVVLAQFLTMILIYFGLARLCKLETLSYLLETMKGYIRGSRNSE